MGSGRRLHAAHELCVLFDWRNFLQKQKAAELVAVARSLALEASRASKRQRLQQKSSHRASASSSPVLGARVAVYWPNDKQFYKVKTGQESARSILVITVIDKDLGSMQGYLLITICMQCVFLFKEWGKSAQSISFFQVLV